MTNRYVPIKNSIIGSGLMDYLPEPLTYAQLEKLFGPANGETDDYKVSTQWIISDRYTGATFTVYDYKATSLYDPSGPDVMQFRSHPYRWHIGGRNRTAAAEFIRWIMENVSAA